ncbi:MAG: choice-of-anchor D domain-containing protein, partial [Candidatus Kapaibacterium sp.]
MTLSVNSAPSIATQPTSKEVFVDESVTLSVTAENPGGEQNELTYQWKKNGNNIANANTSTFNISKVALDDAGKYSVEVKNNCDLTTMSNEVEVKVLENNGGPSIATSLDLLDLGTVNIGENKSETFTDFITNAGDENLIITGMTITGMDANAFTITSPSFPQTLEPDSKLDLVIEFSPSKIGLNEANIIIESNSVNNVTIGLKGNGNDNGTLVSTVNSISFGSAVINEEVVRKFDLQNPTSKSITIIEVSSSSTDFVTNDITNKTIAPTGSEEVIVSFTPTKEEDYDEVLTIKSDDGNTIEIPLTAKGI